MKKLKKGILIVSGISFFLATICIVFLPKIISSHWGKQFLTHIIENNTGAHAEIGKISLTWFGKQKIENFHYKKDSEIDLTFESLQSDSSFFTLLLRRGNIGTTTLEKPRLEIQTSEKVEKASSVPNRVVKIVPQKKVKGFWNNFSGSFNIIEGQLFIQNREENLISMQNLSIDFNVSKEIFPLKIKSQGITKQKDLYGRFDVQAKMGRDKLEGEAHIQNFPVEGLDQISALIDPRLKGVFLESFGDTLNLDLLARPKEQTHDALLQVRSPRLFIDLSSFYQKGTLHLKNPARITWIFKPFFLDYFLERLNSSFPIELLSDGKMEVEFKTGQINMKDFKFDWNSFSGTGNLCFYKITFFLPTLKENLFLDELKVDFLTSGFEENFTLDFENSIRFSSFPKTSIQGHWVLNEMLKAKENLILFFSGLNMNVQNFPLSLIDSWKGWDSKITQLFGSNLNLNIRTESEKFLLDASTPICAISNAEFETKEHIKLLKPVELNYQLDPTLYSELTHPILITGNLNQLNIPLKKNHVDWFESIFGLSLSAKNIDLINPFSLGVLHLPEAHLCLKGQHLESIEFEGRTQLNFASGTWGSSLMGPAVDIKTTGGFKVNDQMEVSSLKINFDGSKFKSEVVGAIKEKSLILKKTLAIDLLLEPDQINPILSKKKECPLLGKSTPIHIEIKPTAIPISESSPFRHELKGTASILSLSMLSPSRDLFSFENVGIDFEMNEEKQTLRLDATAPESNQGKGAVELVLERQRSGTNLIKKPSKVRVQLCNFSSQIADMVFQTHGQLPDMIGSKLNLHYEMKEKRGHQNIDIFVESQDLNLNGSFTIKDNQIELKSSHKPLKIEWNVTEKGLNAFQRWRKPNAPHNDALFQVMGTSTIKVQVASLIFPLKKESAGFPKIDLNLYQSLFNADLRIQDLKLKQKNSQSSTQLDRLDLNISKQNVGGPLTFNVQGKMIPTGAKKTGQIRGEGKLENFLLPNGSIDFRNLSTSIHASIKHLPSIFLDAFAKLDLETDFPPSAFLGERFNATLDAEITKADGSISMDVDASACHATFSSVVINGIVYLQKPFQATMTVTPQLNQILSKNAKIAIVSMKQPITLVIHDKDFAVPLKDFHLRSINFSYGRLDLGQVVCRNTGSASDVSSIFKMDTDGSNRVSLWFAPMEFRMKQGLMYIDRTEILYNSAYQVALWGDIDFKNRFVGMILGLTAQSLRSALGIQKLSSDYVLTVPIRGPFSNVKVDKRTATGKIALLIGRKQIAPQTGIWGSVLGKIGNMADDQSEVPPPKPPFPWKELLNMREKSLSMKQFDKLSKKKAKAYLQDLKIFLKP